MPQLRVEKVAARSPARSGTRFEARQRRCTTKVTEAVNAPCTAIVIMQPPHCCMATHPSTCTVGKTLKEPLTKKKKNIRKKFS